MWSGFCESVHQHQHQHLLLIEKAYKHFYTLRTCKQAPPEIWILAHKDEWLLLRILIKPNYLLVSILQNFNMGFQINVQKQTNKL